MKRIIAMALAVLLALSLAAGLAEGDRDVVKQVQQALNEAGYECGTPDGVAGNMTRAAIERYRKDQGLPASTEIDDALLQALGLMEAPDERTVEESLASFQTSLFDPATFSGVVNQLFRADLQNVAEALAASGYTVDDVYNYYATGRGSEGAYDDGRAWVEFHTGSGTISLFFEGARDGGAFEAYDSVTLEFSKKADATLNSLEKDYLRQFLNVCDLLFGPETPKIDLTSGQDGLLHTEAWQLPNCKLELGGVLYSGSSYHVDFLQFGDGESVTLRFMARSRPTKG